MYQKRFIQVLKNQSHEEKEENKYRTETDSVAPGFIQMFDYNQTFGKHELPILYACVMS